MSFESQTGIIIRTAQLSDLDEILHFENEKLKEQVHDEAERMLLSWHARWRKESLEHYLNLGWSFVLRDSAQASSYSGEGKLLGYFLAQPFLFVEGMTQTLWVEYLSYQTLQNRDELVQLAYKLSRDKHFQKVIFPNTNNISHTVQSLKPEAWAPSALAVKTSKL